AAGADGFAPRPAGGGFARASARRAHGRHPPPEPGAQHVRQGRLAAHRLLRPPAGDRRALYLDRQPVPVRGRPVAVGPARIGPVLERAGRRLDQQARLVGAALPDRQSALRGVSDGVTRRETLELLAALSLAPLDLEAQEPVASPTAAMPDLGNLYPQLAAISAENAPRQGFLDP